jgi:hypothetical protein
MVQIGTNWKCPYCGYAQVLDKRRADEDWHRLDVEGRKEDGSPSLGVVSIVCANDECRELSLSVRLGENFTDANRKTHTVATKSWTLLPPGKPQPNFIPRPIRDDY